VETAPTTVSADSKAGAPPSDRIPDATPADVTRISQSPSEQDPYLVRLAVHLAHELERLKIPAIGQLSEKTRMEIELHLMKNGTLTRARVTKSTGIKRIDEAAYRAALAASPYPEPPPDNDNQDRFEVELVFSPKRL
jgi:protein TonB